MGRTGAAELSATAAFWIFDWSKKASRIIASPRLAPKALPLAVHLTLPRTLQPDVNTKASLRANSVSLILMNEPLSGVSSSTHHGSVGKCNLDALAPVRSIAKRMDGHVDWHARGERLRLPALARQTTRPAHLDRPLLRPPVLINWPRGRRRLRPAKR